MIRPQRHSILSIHPFRACAPTLLFSLRYPRRLSALASGRRPCSRQSAARAARHITGLASDMESGFMAAAAQPRPTKLLVDDSSVRSWLEKAGSGDAIEYHRGLLVLDRLAGSRLSEGDRTTLDRVAAFLLELALRGRGHVLQRRHGGGDYSYIFVKGPSVPGGAS